MRRCGAAAPAAVLRVTVIFAVCAMFGCGPQAAPVVAPARRFTYSTPAWISSRNRWTSASSSEYTPAVSP